MLSETQIWHLLAVLIGVIALGPIIRFPRWIIPITWKTEQKSDVYDGC
jgi:hypothetical protein